MRNEKGGRRRKKEGRERKREGGLTRDVSSWLDHQRVKKATSTNQVNQI